MILSLTYYGHDLLREKAKPVEEIDPKIKQLVEDMVETMVELEFSGVEGEAEGIKCPKCEIKYILEETVINKVFPAEAELSYK